MQEPFTPGPQPVLKVVLVDDEPLARARLRFLLQQLSSGPVASQVVGEADDAPMALQRLAETAADLILLDVRMPGPDGVELARQLRRSALSPDVIFVTAHADHALEAFEVEALDYLPKPVTLARLEAALLRVLRRRLASSPVAPPAVPPLQRVLTVSHRGSLKRVAVQDVLYLKSEWKYVTLRTATEQHLLDDSLLELEQRLGAGFLRVHRNALVAVSAIDALQRREGQGLEAWSVRVRLVDEWIDVSRRQVAAVRKVLSGEVD